MNIRISEVIRKKRDELRLTQEQLADKLGVTKAAVSKWELAQCLPDVTLLPDIAEIFQISIDELFGKEHIDTENVGIDFTYKENTLKIFAAYGNKLLKAVEFNDAMRNIKIELPFDVENVDSQFSVHCGNVGGDVSAKGSVECGDVDGDVSANGSIVCGDVGGDVSANGSVGCENIGGDVSTNGSVVCGDISGDIHAQNVTSGK